VLLLPLLNRANLAKPLPLLKSLCGVSFDVDTLFPFLIPLSGASQTPLNIATANSPVPVGTGDVMPLYCADGFYVLML
jgi:hypothetical protein